MNIGRARPLQLTSFSPHDPCLFSYLVVVKANQLEVRKFEDKLENEGLHECQIASVTQSVQESNFRLEFRSHRPRSISSTFPDNLEQVCQAFYSLLSLISMESNQGRESMLTKYR